MEAIIYVGITHAVFVALWMMSKRPKQLSDKICAIWMLFLSLPLISMLFRLAFPGCTLPGFSSITAYPLTFGPFLILYVRSLIDEHPKVRRRDGWHFVPFMGFALLQMLFPASFLLPGFGISQQSQQCSWFHWFYAGAVVLSLLGYTARVLRLLNHHAQHVLEYFSVIPISITLKWLRWLTCSFATAYGIVLLIDNVFPLFRLSPPPWPPIHFHALAFTGFILIFSFFSLKQPPIFQQREQKPEISSETMRSPENPEQEKHISKYEKSGLTDDRSQMYLQRLEAYIRREKPYLNADLTLEELAKDVSIPRHYLTQVLNEQLHKNFYTYINEYRIEEVKRRLRDRESDHLTLLAIAYESGFNSKSTFNTTFKKFTHFTPSQFRKLHIAKGKTE